MNKNKQKFVPVLSNIVYHLTGKISLKKKVGFLFLYKKEFIATPLPKFAFQLTKFALVSNWNSLFLQPKFHFFIGQSSFLLSLKFVILLKVLIA